MKQILHSHGLLLFLVLLLLLSSYSATAARLLIPRQGEGEEMTANGFSQVSPIVKIEPEDSWNLMGLEDCENGDEECLKRRMISEAHLDYIYTQHHNKP